MTSVEKCISWAKREYMHLGFLIVKKKYHLAAFTAVEVVALVTVIVVVAVTVVAAVAHWWKSNDHVFNIF